MDVTQFCYGREMHDDDAGPNRNETEGPRLLKMLADQKYTGATNHYGMCLFTGSGVETNHREAMKYFKQAANENNGWSFSALGICRLLKLGCCVNRTEAKESFKLSADLGDGIREFNYGLLLSDDLRNESEER
jgi:TPR repeat protein